LPFSIIKRLALNKHKKDLFQYIEVYYNRFRKHSFDGYLTP
jgi:transposase InsO family protein